ncbi:hypothetical protein UF75_3398 [Desulfosporosinus sp. I2]|nr:hypothetical protein [Desulfosporosinus sp. I2]KJR46194.1 hypothetical protein UF75_3398 [Desulfosporosinus sp. I2]
MSINSEYNAELLIASKEREDREHVFNILGSISAAIIVIVFVIAKLQS